MACLPKLKQLEIGDECEGGKARRDVGKEVGKKMKVEVGMQMDRPPKGDREK